MKTKPPKVIDAKVRLMSIRLIGHIDDVEKSAHSLKCTGSVIEDSDNYPVTGQKEVRRYLKVVVATDCPVQNCRKTLMPPGVGG